MLGSCIQDNPKAFDLGNLWEITSKNGIESYIFGTLHSYPIDELKISKNAFSHLRKCKTLALEIDLTDTTNIEKFINFKMPEYFVVGDSVLMSQYRPDELASMEEQLIKVAEDQGLKIIGLESTEESLRMMKKFGDVKIPKREMNTERMLEVFQGYFEMYKKENIGEAKDSLSNQQPREMSEVLIDERNINWLDDIMESLEKEPTFIAVGMGHLGGKDGLLNLLFKEGYKLERVK